MTKTKFEVMDICNEVDIPVGPILSMKEIAEEQSLRDTGTVVEVDHPTRGKYLTVGNPVKMSDSITEVKRSPLLGEHTEEILTKVLGYSAKETRRDQEFRRDHAAGEAGGGGGVADLVSRACGERVTAAPRDARRVSQGTHRRDLGEREDMRIVVHGQQAFGKAVLEALLKRGENVVAVYVAPEKPGAEGRSAEGSRARRQAADLSAGVLPQAGSVGGVQGAQARPAGDGVRHAVRAGGIPQHPDPRLDPVSPLAAAGLSRRRARSTGRSSRARRKPGCRSSGPTTGSIPATCWSRRRRRSATPTRSARSISTACSRWASRRCWNRSTW